MNSREVSVLEGNTFVVVLPKQIGELALRGLSGPKGTYDAEASKSPTAA